MENFDSLAISDLSALPQDSELLPPLLLRRPMVLFKKAMGLDPGKRAVPHPDFFFRVLSDHGGHQAWLRSLLGDQYKNFENLIAGRATSGTTKFGIAERAALTPEVMLAWALLLREPVRQGEPDGHRDLLPGVARIVTSVADLPYQLHRVFMAHGHHCPHCGADVLQDVDPWWTQHSGVGDAQVQLGRNEYWFAERLLTTLFVTIEGLAAPVPSSPEGLLRRLTEPSKHPMRNWLDMVLDAYEVKKFPELVAKLSSTAGATDRSMAQRLRKWSCGTHDLMPVRRGHELIESLSERRRSRHGESLKLSLLAARSTAFVIDFIQAAALQSVVSRQTAQRLVDARLQQIALNQRIAISGERALRVEIGQR